MSNNEIMLKYSTMDEFFNKVFDLSASPELDLRDPYRADSLSVKRVLAKSTPVLSLQAFLKQLVLTS